MRHFQPHRWMLDFPANAPGRLPVPTDAPHSQSEGCIISVTERLNRGQADDEDSLPNSTIKNKINIKGTSGTLFVAWSLVIRGHRHHTHSRITSSSEAAAAEAAAAAAPLLLLLPPPPQQQQEEEEEEEDRVTCDHQTFRIARRAHTTIAFIQPVLTSTIQPMRA